MEETREMSPETNVLNSPETDECVKLAAAATIEALSVLSSQNPSVVAKLAEAGVLDKFEVLKETCSIKDAYGLAKTVCKHIPSEHKSLREKLSRVLENPRAKAAYKASCGS